MVKRFVLADVEREWGWLGLTPKVEVEFSRRPVIVADRIIGGDSSRAMMIAVTAGAKGATGTSGSVVAPCGRGTRRGSFEIRLAFA